MPLNGKRELMARLRGNSWKFVRGLVLEVHGRLIRKTPVLSGRARNNWNIATGTPDTGTTPPGDYPQNGQEAMARGVSQIADIQAGDVIYDTNALPYIPALEDGSSKQAPAGMIKVTVAEIQPLVRQIAAKIAAGGE